jgi:ATP-dependent Zn protease
VSGILQGDSCNFNQNIVLDVFSTAVITQVMKNVMSGVLVQDIIQNVKLVQKTKSSLTWLWILLGIVALLGLIGLVWFIYKKQHGSSSSAGTSGTGGGTNIIFSPGATRPTTTTPAPAPAPVLPTPRVTPAASSVS